MLSVGLEGEEYCEMGEVHVWVYDSGASTHRSPDADFLMNYRERQGAVRLADSRRLPIVGVGDLLLHFRCDSRVIALQLRNVAHTPELSHHLISLGRIAGAGHEYSCDGKGLKL